MKLVPTQEQLSAIDVVHDNQFVKLIAFAGCSKTTTLTMVASQIDCPSLYLAYIKAMADEAKEKFPSWVTVKTTHALAFGVYGRQLVDKLKRPTGAYQNVCGTGSEIARYFDIKHISRKVGGLNIPVLTANGIGLAVRETVNRFEFSADEELKYIHISPSALKNKSKDEIPPEILNKYKQVVFENAQKLWKLRINPNSNILCTHDTYLKLYQLSKPDLSGYPMIYLDEGQDTNQCVLDIIMRQKQSKMVVVGDPYQQIYQFRGSVNAMQQLPFKSSGLSQSFRFGQEIADIANVILSHEGDIETNIRGWDKVNSRVLDTLDTSKVTFTYTILYRTNMALVLDAVQFLDEGKKVNLEIDVKDFIKLLESAVELKAGNKAGVKHDELLAYTDWSDFSEEVKGKSNDLSRVHKIIADDSHVRIITMLKTQKNVKDPDITLTTAHKSKGREFDVVVLADDFPSCYNDKKEWVGLNEAERNLLYVGATRARRILVKNETLREILTRDDVPVEEVRTITEAFDAVVREAVRELELDMQHLD